MSNYVQVRSEGVCFRVLLLYPIFFCARHLRGGLFLLLLYSFLGGRVGRDVSGCTKCRPCHKLAYFHSHFHVYVRTLVRFIYSPTKMLSCVRIPVSHIYSCTAIYRPGLEFSSFSVAFPRLVYLSVYPSSVIFFKIE